MVERSRPLPMILPPRAAIEQQLSPDQLCVQLACWLCYTHGLDVKQPIKIRKCGHGSFCSSCIRSILVTRDTCPRCSVQLFGREVEDYQWRLHQKSIYYVLASVTALSALSGLMDFWLRALAHLLPSFCTALEIPLAGLQHQVLVHQLWMSVDGVTCATQPVGLAKHLFTWLRINRERALKVLGIIPALYVSPRHIALFQRHIDGLMSVADLVILLVNLIFRGALFPEMPLSQLGRWRMPRPY